MLLTGSLPLPALPNKISETRWSGLIGCAKAEVIAALFSANPQRQISVIVPDLNTAYSLEKSLQYCLGEHKKTVSLFPDWETLPYDHFSPPEEIISDRLRMLQALQQKSCLSIIALPTARHRLLPKNTLLKSVLALKCGDSIKLTEFRQYLSEAAYRPMPQVLEHGEFAIRGSIIDLFPMGSASPFRIELFDETIETIRYFDPETQLSGEKIKEIAILNAKEFPMTAESIALFRQQWREHFTGNPLNCPLYEKVSQGICANGLEYYLPLFYESTNSFFDYLPKETLIIKYDEHLLETSDRITKSIANRYDQMCYDITRPILSPDKLFLSSNQLFEYINQFQRLTLTQILDDPKTDHSFDLKPIPNLALKPNTQHPFSALKMYWEEADTETQFICHVESAGRAEILMNLLKDNAIPVSSPTENADQSKIQLVISPLTQGYEYTAKKQVIFTEYDLFGYETPTRTYQKKNTIDPNDLIRNLAELQLNAPIVHITHGIGRYRGLKTLTINERIDEFLVIEYANQDKLYVPVSSLHLISRYSGGDPDLAPINRLGSPEWEKAKQKAAEKISDVATDLLDLYAHRAARKGERFTVPEEAYRAFVQGFPFEETPDQASTISAVLADLGSDKPMDRLVCGDVGFGKTEVAMRAAFVVAHAGKQVVVLAPTTLLAQQHYETFTDRFTQTALKIEMLSRFRSAKQQTRILKELEEGKIDIIIGTHKLLSTKIPFKDLGLLIIDEEHRFGVKQKEQIKSLRANIDLLTLTATPIPRTLNLSLSSIRDLSLITTPPARRLKIKTFVSAHERSLIREAILREYLRGGQVYFLHNSVETIEAVLMDLRLLVPEVNIAFAHGQMHERELERIMSDFYHQRFQVLVCTTIIETGIDIPTANTIIIDRADKFGLAQLHQLRGRVGRSHHQAYAYLLIPREKKLTKDAEKRLEAIASFQDLGAGFMLASHDLEIRGAGELLGEGQSGHIQTIGFSLYMELLDKTVKALQRGEKIQTDKLWELPIEIDLKISAIIPEAYLPDVHTRLMLYKRISYAKTTDNLRQLQVEMIDRFGLLPEATQHLFRLMQIKLSLEKIGIIKCDCDPFGGKLVFNTAPHINPDNLIRLVQAKGSPYRFDGPTTLRFKRSLPTILDRFQFIEALLAHLQTEQTSKMI